MSSKYLPTGVTHVDSRERVVQQVQIGSGIHTSCQADSSLLAAAQRDPYFEYILSACEHRSDRAANAHLFHRLALHPLQP